MQRLEIPREIGAVAQRVVDHDAGGPGCRAPRHRRHQGPSAPRPSARQFAAQPAGMGGILGQVAGLVRIGGEIEQELVGVAPGRPVHLRLPSTRATSGAMLASAAYSIGTGRARSSPVPVRYQGFALAPGHHARTCRRRRARPASASRRGSRPAPSTRPGAMPGPASISGTRAAPSRKCILNHSPLLAEHVAVVGGEEDDRVLCLPGALEHREDLADLAVEIGDVGEIGPAGHGAHPGR